MSPRFRLRRAHAILVHDVAVAAAAFVVAVHVSYRDQGWAFAVAPGPLGLGLAVVTLVSAAVFASLGLHRGLWRYASLDDAAAVLRAVTLAMLASLAALFVIHRGEALPRSALPIAWALTIGGLIAPRALYRLWREREILPLFRRAAPDAAPALIIGAGDRAERFIRAQARDAAAAHRPVAILDRAGRRVGQSLRGVPILGGLDDLAAVVDRLDQDGARPQRLLIDSDRIDQASIHRLIEAADGLALPVSLLPGAGDLAPGPDAAGRIEPRPIAIEDLLGRPQAALDRAATRALLKDRRVLITGAGGSIGGELARQIAAAGPARLALLDASEHALYQIDLEMAERFQAMPRAAWLADVRDRARIGEVLAAERPDLVFHAAALKHVPIAEAHPLEAILTNAVGSRIVLDLARAHGVARVVMISTDKAVNPANVMGATKRLAETYAQALDRAGGACRFVTVRFGNVLGSTGSVVPLFQRQLAAGGPLTVTHPDITRYFMTIREAVELVLQASAPGVADADAGRICVLDMGEPVRILHLAEQVIRLAGKRPHHDVAIAFTGLRPGEKLYEELFHESEPLVASGAPGVRLAAPRAADAGLLARALDELEALARDRRTEPALAALARLTPEWRRDGAGAEAAAGG